PSDVPVVATGDRGGRAVGEGQHAQRGSIHINNLQRSSEGKRLCVCAARLRSWRCSYLSFALLRVLGVVLQTLLLLCLDGGDALHEVLVPEVLGVAPQRKHTRLLNIINTRQLQNSHTHTRVREIGVVTSAHTA